MKKRIFCIVLTLALLLCLAPVTALAGNTVMAQNTEVNGESVINASDSLEVSDGVTLYIKETGKLTVNGTLILKGSGHVVVENGGWLEFGETGDIDRTNSTTDTPIKVNDGGTFVANLNTYSKAFNGTTLVTSGRYSQHPAVAEGYAMESITSGSLVLYEVAEQKIISSVTIAVAPKIGDTVNAEPDAYVEIKSIATEAEGTPEVSISEANFYKLNKDDYTGNIIIDADSGKAKVVSDSETFSNDYYYIANIKLVTSNFWRFDTEATGLITDTKSHSIVYKDNGIPYISIFAYISPAEPLEDTEISASLEDDSKPISPKTGDDSALLLWVGLLLMSGVAVTTMTVGKKKFDR
jgi:LPXTG-motif cell wall-anchored protein